MMDSFGKIELLDSTDIDNKIPVFSCPAPFSDRRVDFSVPSGSNVKDIIDQVGNHDLSLMDIHVFVDDLYIERSNWACTYPYSGQVVAINVVPAGGGGKDILRVVAMIGVLALSWYVGPAGLAIGGKFSGIVAAGVGVAGSLAVNALIPPTAPKMANETGFDSPSLSVLGTRNVMSPFGPVPRIFGKHRVWPQFAAKPYVETSGPNTTVRMLFQIGIGDYDLSDFKLGDTALSSYSGYTLTEGVYNASSDVGKQYPWDVNQADLSVEILNSGGWYEQTTAVNTTQINVELSFVNGLYIIDDDDGRLRSHSVELEAEYRVTSPQGSWIAFAGSPHTVSGLHRTRVTTLFQKGGLSADQYDVRVRRNTTDYPAGPGGPDGSVYVCDTYWTSLRSIQQGTTPPVEVDDGCYFVALDIQANDQLPSGMLDSFNCIAEAKLSAWTGSAWGTPAKTRNPAWAFAEVLRSADGDANQRPVADAKIDGDGLLAWAGRCTTEGYNFDAVIDSKTTVKQLLNDIAAVGRASRAIVDGLHTVVEDINQSTPRQHFSPRNSFGFKAIKNFPDYPHALKCRFIRESADYQQDEITIYDDGYDVDTATLFETMDFWGVTDADHIWKLARYYIAAGRLRPELIEINVDPEHLVCTRGDLVRLTHDVMLVGLGQGRITAIDGNDVTIDDTITMEGGKTYAAQIRKADGTMLDTTITLDVGEQTTITLGSVAGIAVGDLLFFGESGSVSSDCIVTRIQHGEDLIAKLTLVDEAPAVYTADSGEIPTYDPNITEPTIVNRAPAAPIIDSITLIMWPILIEGTNKVNQLHAAINFSLGISTGIPPLEFEAQYRELDITPDPDVYGEWIPLAPLKAGARDFRVPVENGNTYDFRIRSVSQFGLTSDWDTESTYTVSYTSVIVPNDITGLALAQGGATWSGKNCEVTWDLSADSYRVKQYKLAIYKTTPLTFLRAEFLDVADHFYSYTYSKNYEDNAGSPLGGLTFRIWAVGLDPDETLSDNYDELVVTHTAPSSVTSLAANDWLGGVLFTWDDNTDAAFSHFLYRIQVESDGWSSWYAQRSNFVNRQLSTTEKAAHGPNANIQIEVKAVNVFGTESGASATNDDAGSLLLETTDIDNWPEHASNLWPNMPIPDGIGWTNNSPSAGYVAWTSGNIWLGGSQHAVNSGNSNKKYIFWKDFAGDLAGDDTDPVTNYSNWDPAEDFIITINNSGVAEVGYWTMAHAFIGRGMIEDLAVNNAKIEDLDGSKITASSLTLIGTATDFNWSSLVDDGNKPENDATAGATWDVDITDQPTGIQQIFYQSSAPVAGMSTGDFWIDSDDNKIYRYDGTWGEVQDNDIAQAISDAADAQSTADGKIVTFIQASAPTAEGIGDIWFDSDDNNKPYRWNGADWVAAEFDVATWSKILGSDKPEDNATRSGSYNLIIDPNFDKTTAQYDNNYWQTETGVMFWGATLGYNSEAGFRIGTDGTDNNAWARDGGGNTFYFPAINGEKFFVRFRAFCGPSFNGTMGAVLQVVDKSSKSYLQNLAVTFSGGSLTLGSWATYEGVVTITNANAAFCAVFLTVQSDATLQGVDFDDIVVMRHVGLDGDYDTSNPLKSSKIDTSITTGTSLVALSSAGIYGFDSSGNNRFYLQTNGTFAVGNPSGDDFLNYDGTNVIYSTSKSGGGIVIASGADMILEGGSSGNPSMIRLRDGVVSGEIRLEDSADADEYLCITKVDYAASYHRTYIGPSPDGVQAHAIHIGRNEDTDEVAVVELCASLGIEFEIGKTAILTINSTDFTFNLPIDLNESGINDYGISGDVIIYNGNIQMVNAGYWIGYDSTPLAKITFQSGYILINNTPSDTAAQIVKSDHASYASSCLLVDVVRAANSAYNMFAGYSGDWADMEFKLSGDGNGTCDGSWTGGGADYAEYFEWADGNLDDEDRCGITVILEGDKIRAARQNEKDDIVGVVSNNPSFVGDAAAFRWHNKYLRNSFGGYELDDNGDRVLNPEYDDGIDYTPREQRAEWDMIGIVGKVRVRKGAPVHPNWIKLRDIDAHVSEWLIR